MIITNKWNLMKDLEKIYKIDLIPIRDRLMEENGWTERIADHAVDMYRHFLYILLKHGGKQMLSPSKQIDEAWHAHILFTKKYAQDCEAIFGRFLHHTPGGPDDNRGDYVNAFLKFQELHKQEFGYEVYDLRYAPYDLYLWAKNKFFTIWQ